MSPRRVRLTTTSAPRMLPGMGPTSVAMSSLLATLLATSLACSGSSKAPTEPVEREDNEPKPPAFDAGRVKAQLGPYLENIGASWGEGYRFSGYVHVVNGDRVLYSRGFGTADRISGKPNTADTSFRTGSVTKQFTAAAIMKLAEAGKLDVSDPLGKHLPSYPEPAASKVTIHHLLTHTSGIPSYTNFAEVMDSRDRPRTVDEMIALFADRPLEFAPGSDFRYSNSGYILLGAIIEKVSGQRYADYMQSALFAPAGLTSTEVGDAVNADDRAEGYQTNASGEVEQAHDIDMSVPYAAGAIRSTANDLVRWDRALRSGTVLSKTSREAMYTPHPESIENGTGYGYGWLITRGKDRIFHHGGGIDGFLTSYLRTDATDLVVVVWTNNPIVDVDQIKENVVAVLFGGEVEPADETPPKQVSSQEIAEISGNYSLDADSRKQAAAAGVPEDVLKTVDTVELKGSGTGLVLKPMGQPELALFRKAPDTYFSKQAHVTVTLQRGPDGKVTGLSIAQGPLRLLYRRTGAEQ